MNYYIAREQESAPYITFEQVANSIEELDELGMTDHPLIVSEERLTNPEREDYISFEYGICHVRIFNGELVPRDSFEIIEAQEMLVSALNVQKSKRVSVALEGSTFLFHGLEFPLHPSSITVYRAIIGNGSENRVMSTTGVVMLSAEDLPAFESALNDAIIEINDLSIDS